MGKKNGIFWKMQQDKVKIWRLRQFEKWPQGFRRRQKRRGGNSSRVETRMRELKKKCVTILILSQWINSGWLTFRVGPYMLIHIIRNCSGYVKCKLHTQNHWQGTSWIVPGWGEIGCPFSAQQGNAGDWGEVAEGLRARGAPQLLAHQINYKLELRPCSFCLPSFGIVRCLPTGEGTAGTMDTVVWWRSERMKW